MALWDRTHGKAIGAYLAAGHNQLYVRQQFVEGSATGLWSWYLDGILMGAEKAEVAAQAASEAALRSMSRTHTGRMATAAGQPDRAA